MVVILCATYFRALLRLALFRDNGYKMLLHGGETPNVDRPGDQPKPGGNQRPGYFNNHYAQNPWNREGKALAALSRFGENARMVHDPTWLRRTEHSETVMDTQGNYSLVSLPFEIAICSKCFKNSLKPTIICFSRFARRLANHVTLTRSFELGYNQLVFGKLSNKSIVVFLQIWC